MPKKGGKKKTQPKKAQEAPEPTPATPADDDGDDDVQEEVKKGEAAKGAKDLDSVTDRVDTREMDAASTSKALSSLSGAAAKQEDAEELARQKAMAKIKLDEEDVALIMSEFMLERPEAEKALRQNGGDAKACIVATLES